VPYTVARDVCEGIHDCVAVCPTECIVPAGARVNAKGTRFVEILGARCIDCGACLSVCPIQDAIVDAWKPELQGAAPGLPCLRCTATVPDGRRFCPACGTPVASRCAFEDLQLLGPPDLGRVVQALWDSPRRADLAVLAATLDPALGERLRAALGPARLQALAGSRPPRQGVDADAVRAARLGVVLNLKLLVARGAVHYTGRG